MYVTSITSLGNASMTIGSANYSLSSAKTGSSVTVTYSDAASGTWSTGSYWAVIVYNELNPTGQAMRNSTEGPMEITENLELLGLIIILGAVMAVLLMSFGGFMKSGGGL